MGDVEQNQKVCANQLWSSEEILGNKCPSNCNHSCSTDVVSFGVELTSSMSLRRPGDRGRIPL
jgi:hypothetical protein